MKNNTLKNIIKRILEKTSYRILHKNNDIFRSDDFNSSVRGTRQILKIEPQSFDSLLEHLSKNIGIIELARSKKHIRVGIGIGNIPKAIYILSEKSPLGTLEIETKKVHLGMPDIEAKIKNANFIKFSFNDTDLKLCEIFIEPYHYSEPKKWVSRNKRNRIMRAVYSDILSKPGINRAVDVLGGPSLHAQFEDHPVDAVYTWVNHEDPEWKEQYAFWSRTTGSKQTTSTPNDADALNRFHNNDELRYSLRGLEKNMPWLRHIFIFSNCAAPPWLDTKHPRLTWVHHEDVIPSEFLPTFNSHVIESFLHRIPKISDRFIYLNDDVFVVREQSKSCFFTIAGQSKSFLEGYGMVSGDLREEDPDYLNASRNSAGLVRSHLGFVPTQLHQHVPFSLLRPVLEEIEERFYTDINSFRVNRFRRLNDINVTSFLYHHYAIGVGKAVSDSKPSIMVKSSDSLWPDRLKKMESSSYEFLCINEGGTDTSGGEWHRATRAFLESCYPKPALWERFGR